MQVCKKGVDPRSGVGDYCRGACFTTLYGAPGSVYSGSCAAALSWGGSDPTVKTVAFVYSCRQRKPGHELCPPFFCGDAAELVTAT